MSNVQFEDHNNSYTVAKKKGLSAMVISWGLAKDEKGAQVVLLIIAVLAAAVAIFFMVTGGSSAEIPANIPPGGPAGF